MSVDRTKTQFRRLQALDVEIRDGRYPNCLSFSVDWEASQKTIQRDVEFMKYSLGAPIEYDRGKQGYYYTDTNWFLPALNVSEGELFALMLGAQALSVYSGTPIAGTLRGILAKISAALPDVVSVIPEDAFQGVSFVGSPARPIDPEMWRTVVRSIRGRVAVNVTYRAEAKPTNKSYTIHPYHLANLHGDWYLLACIPPHDDVTQFALSRFEKAILTNDHFPAPDRHAVEDRLHEAFGKFIRTGGDKLHQVRVAFTKDIAHRITARQWHFDQKLKQRKDGSGTLEFPAASLDEVTRWVLSWGRHMKVLVPAELHRMCNEQVRGMIAEYDTDCDIR
ncbi:MAG: putative DNA-binding transcriptional regulator YafY [Candidatus Azotimanducaceae bacterium]|jgi:predicted DNA-binding transcriptional regulator YafY